MGLAKCRCGYVMPNPFYHGKECKLYNHEEVYPSRRRFRSDDDKRSLLAVALDVPFDRYGCL